MCAHAARRLAHLPLARCVLDACAARLGYPDRAAYARMFAWSTASEWFRLGYSLRELLGIQVRMPGDSSTPNAQRHKHLCMGRSTGLQTIPTKRCQGAAQGTPCTK